MAKKKQVRVSFRISTRLHSLMRELFLRYRVSRRNRIGGFYLEALAAYVREAGVPKRSEVITRERVDLVAPAQMRDVFEKVSRIAAFRNVPEYTVIEEAIEQYLERADNYLDEGVYRKHRRKWRHYK